MSGLVSSYCEACAAQRGEKLCTACQRYIDEREKDRDSHGGASINKTTRELLDLVGLFAGFIQVFYNIEEELTKEQRAAFDKALGNTRVKLRCGRATSAVLYGDEDIIQENEDN